LPAKDLSSLSDPIRVGILSLALSASEGSLLSTIACIDPLS
jgi:hypothetical protein